MRARVAIVYNEFYPSRYDIVGETEAVRDVLDAVEAVRNALVELSCDVSLIPLSPPLEQAKETLKCLQADIVFNLFEGFCDYPQTEVLVPETLAETGVPFTGCPATLMKLALDKAEVKSILKTAGIQTPPFQLLNSETLHTFQIGYPCIVKPRCENASHGLSPESIVRDFKALERQVNLMNTYYTGGALVERFIDGAEFNATVLGSSECNVLPISEIAYSLPVGMPRILTFAAKWEPSSLYFQGTRVICPAEVEDTVRQHITKTVATAFQVLGGKGYARVDMRMDNEGNLNVIEVNPNPNISPASGAALQAKASGMNYTQFIRRIMELALEIKPQWALTSVP